MAVLEVEAPRPAAPRAPRVVTKSLVVSVLASAVVGAVVCASYRAADGSSLHGSTRAPASRRDQLFKELQRGSGDGGLNAQKVSELLTLGVDALTNAITIFSDDEPDIEYGFQVAQVKLWKLITKIVPDGEQDSEKMTTAKQVWDSAFESAPDITEDVMDFRKSGDTDKLISAVQTILSTGLSGCSKVFPEEAKYFTALEDLLAGIGESWDEFTAGNTVKAVEVVWGALKTSVDDLVPEEWADDDTYALVMGTVDRVIGNLSHHVLEYKRRILNSKVCYKRSQHRERARPSVCDEGYEWDQMTMCLPQGSSNGAHCLPPCGGQGGMCESFCGEGMACCRQGDSKDPAECEGATGFVLLGLAEGASTDYHQCVRAGPNLALTVKGAGVRALNGLYVQSGEHSGKPRYVKVRSQEKTVLEWSQSRKAWRFFIDDTLLGRNRPTLYKSAEDTATFPSSGWVAEEGAQPAPMLVPYAPVASARLAQVNVSARRAPRGAHPASCDPDSKHPEQRGMWCLSACPAGFEPSGGTNCVQACGGGFPAEGMGVCGVNQGELVIATTEMVSMVANGAIESYLLISDMKETGVRADKLSATIDVFIDMGKPFARPQCPVAER